MSQKPTSKLAVNVALCVHGDAFDRLGHALRYLAVGLIDQAIRTRLISSDDRLSSLSLGPIRPIIHDPITWPFINRRINQTVELLADDPPTIVHALSSASYEMALKLAKTYEADLILQVGSTQDCDYIAQIPDSDVGAYFALTQPLAKILQQQLRIPANKIILSPLGVYASRNASPLQNPEQITTLLCTTPFNNAGGVHVLLQAVDVLRKRGHAMLAFLIGEGRDEPALRKLVRDRGLNSMVAFAQPVGNISSLMSGADVYVLPDKRNAVSMDGLIAMAAGLVTVTFPSAIDDAYIADETALVCDAPTVAALTDTLERIITNPDTARNIAAAGQAYIKENHSVSAMAELAASVYRKLNMAHATLPFKGS